MARPPTVTIDDVLAQLSPGTPVAAADLIARLAVGRTTLSRLMADAGDRVVRLGRGRATYYIARQTTVAGTQWPLFRMGPDATLEDLGVLVALSGDTFHMQATAPRPNLQQPPEGGIPGFFPGLPWYLDDLRPQGFLGRTFAHRRGREFGVPEDLNAWQLGHVLQAVVRAGGTEAGDLLIGGEAVRAALAALDAPADSVHSDVRLQRYPERAAAALEGEDVGSSPGGEQPKFTATVEADGHRVAVLVKFAEPGAGPAAERWSDLLACEHLALECLREAGIPAAATSVLQGERLRFLEVQRFDRTPDVLGRRGFVSLQSLAMAFIGEGTLDWARAGERLQADRWISQDTASTMAKVHAYGRLIGNSDMHQGNIGFHLVDDGPLPLAPIYDMLPMSLAPSRTGVLRAATPLTPVAPERSGELEALRWATPIAEAFWARVAGSALVHSPALRELAGVNARQAASMARRFG